MSGVNANITNPAKTTKAEVDHKNYNKCNDHSYNSVSVSGFVFQPSPSHTHTHSPHPPHHTHTFFVILLLKTTRANHFLYYVYMLPSQISWQLQIAVTSPERKMGGNKLNSVTQCWTNSDPSLYIRSKSIRKYMVTFNNFFSSLFYDTS